MSREPSSRWVNVGVSIDPVAKSAGLAATRAAVDRPDAKLVVVFASFDYDLPELLAGVAGEAGDVPVIGCSTAGEIGPGPRSAKSVVAVGFGGDFDVRTTHAVGLQEDARGVGERVGAALLPLPSAENRLALMFTDSLAGDQQEMIRGVYSKLGATVPLVGGGAGDNMRMVTSRQFYGGEVMQNAAVAACIGSDSPIGVALRHGWRRCSDTMVVTSSTGYDVHTLDDRPALDVYLDRYDAPPGLDSDPAAFAAFALTRPLAISRRGDDAVRHVHGCDVRTRSLLCAAAVPRGASAWLTAGDVTSTLAATEAACTEAIAQLGDAPLRALLVMDCAGRRAVLGDEGIAAEHEVLTKLAGDAALAGFYSYGEIARLRGVSGYHNQVLVAVALS